MTITEHPTSDNSNSDSTPRATRAAKDQQRIDRLRARRRSREWEVRLSHEFIQTWARILHPASFLLFSVLEMFADWRPGPRRGHTGGHQSLADLTALTGLDKNGVRRALKELAFYGLILFTVGDWDDRRKTGCAVDIVVQQDVEAPKVTFRQPFQELSRLESMSARRHRVQNAERTTPQNAERTTPQNAERSTPQNAYSPTPQNAEREESIALDSTQRDISPSSSLSPQPPKTTTTGTPPQADPETETLFKLLPGYFDFKATADLLARCRSVHSDCTLTEVVDFVSFKVELIHTGRIKNPVGFLLAAVPEAMRGWALIDYRANAARAAAATAAKEREWAAVSEALAAAIPANGNGGGHQV